MAKILLLDYEESEFRQLLDKKFDVELRKTNWKTGRVESLRPPQDCRVVLYQVNLDNEASGLHTGDSAGFEKIVADGGAIICFIGACKEYHLNNVIGTIPQLKFEENNLPDKIVEIKDEPFHSLFLQFQAFISHAYELFPASNSLGKVIQLEGEAPSAAGELLILAESLRNLPISVMLRKGKGFYLLLPWFGDKNAEVSAFLLERILPEIAPQLTIEEEEEENWLDASDYVFPELQDAINKLEEENTRHRQVIRQLEEEIGEIKSKEQEPFNKLLTAEGKDLVQAVIMALKHIDWIKVVDVNEYWKRVIRVPEEDLWLLDEDERSVETLIREAHLSLVLVRGGAAGANEEDCLLLQRFKGRRMQEFNNTKMKALLIGNYFVRVEAKFREVPFAETQISEAAKDGNGLLTTYELFKAIKAEKENKITKATIREQITTKVGLIAFDY